MRKSGLSVPIAALLSGLLTAAAAQEPARDSAFPPPEPALSTNSLGRAHTIPPSSVATAKSKPLTGNPLWAIAISELSETHARPIFSPSRRPPAPAAPAALTAQLVKAASPVKPEPDHPLLELLGTIVGGSVEIGVFTDEASHDVIRIKAGEAHDGWTLSAVSGHAAIFQKQGYVAATLVLSAPGGEANAPGVAAAPNVERVAAPGNGQMTGVPPPHRFAPPVIPTTPKGESKRPPREG
jgi:general secretion pathway protein N